MRAEEQVWERLAQSGVVPVIAIDNADAALPLADALLEGGISIIEITFRTTAAAGVIRRLSQERPELLVGAGTVIDLGSLESAKANGASFAVAPGLNPEVVRSAQQAGLPFVPGVATPSDIEMGLSLGCKFLKFFPAEALGGVVMLEALSAPYKHAGVRFIPTGGVSTSNLAAYLKLPTVAAVGGTWLAKQEDLKQSRWREISDRCRTALEIVANTRLR